MIYDLDEFNFDGNKVYWLKRDGIKMQCPGIDQYCGSQCPFFQLGESNKSVMILCRTRAITIFLEGGDTKCQKSM